MLMPQDLSLPLLARAGARARPPRRSTQTVLHSVPSLVLTLGITLTMGSDAIPPLKAGLAYSYSLTRAGAPEPNDTIAA